MSESFKDSYYGRMVFEDEKVTVNGNRASVSGIDKDGKPYTNYFKKRYGKWTFNGYDGDNGQVKNTKPKFKKNNNTTRPDNKEQQKRNSQNRGK